jgi:hypothetical protein
MNRSFVDRLVSATGAIVGVVLLAAAALLFFAHGYVHGQVTDQLRDQQITFPVAGSEAITSLPQADQAAISKYAGQTMVNGAQARAFADHYIKVHLNEVANGQTYSQVSAKALANPDDQKLAGQVQTLFRGETLRGLLPERLRLGHHGDRRLHRRLDLAGGRRPAAPAGRLRLAPRPDRSQRPPPSPPWTYATT